MTRPSRGLLAFVTLLVLAGCQANRAPGNDAEARLDPPAPPSRPAAASEILATVALDELQPEPIEGPALRALGNDGAACRFLLTLDSTPSFVYGADGGTLKLNQTLVSLPKTGDGRFEAGGLGVTVRPLHQATASGTNLRSATMVIRMASNPNERGYRGYVTCDAST